jgi:protein-disulfide isomerase
VSDPSSNALARWPSRRTLILAGVLAVALPSAGLFAQRRPKADPSLDELMKAGDLPEIVLGKADAKVTIIEYASMTCPACASFHTKVLPGLKEKYIDTGKARLIMREFPLNHLAAAASMLARCAGGEKTILLTDELFKRQEAWAFVQGSPVPKLFEIAKQAGFTQESFDKCLTDQKLLDQISAVRDRAAEKFGVDSTPTFFVNGKRLGGSSLSDFEKAIEPLLKS